MENTWDTATPMSWTFTGHNGAKMTGSLFVSRDVKVGSSGPKPPLPRPEKEYRREKLRISPLSGRFQQFRDEYDFIIWSGTSSNTSFNMGYVDGVGYNPNVSTRLESPYVVYDGGLPSGMLNPDLLSQTEVKAMNALRKNSLQSEFDAGLFWAERRETVSMFKEICTGIGNIAQAIRHRDVRLIGQIVNGVFKVETNPRREAARLRKLERSLKHEVRNLSKSSAPRDVAQPLIGAYLGYTLGASPLVNDFEELLKNLMTGDLTVKLRIKARARYGKRPDVWEDRKIILHRRGTCEIASKGTHRHDYQVIVHAVPKHDDLARLARLGVANPAYLNWQAKGGSFLVDHWVAVGDYLHSLTIPLEFGFVDGSWSQRIHDVLDVVISTPAGKMVGGGQYKLFARHVYEDFPVPIFPMSIKEKDLTDRQIITEAFMGLQKVVGAKSPSGVIRPPKF